MTALADYRYTGTSTNGGHVLRYGITKYRHVSGDGRFSTRTDRDYAIALTIGHETRTVTSLTYDDADKLVERFVSACQAWDRVLWYQRAWAQGDYTIGSPAGAGR